MLSNVNRLTCYVVALNLAAHEHHDRLHRGHQPGDGVVARGVLLDGLVSPLEGGGQQPRERQYHPPDGALDCCVGM